MSSVIIVAIVFGSFLALVAIVCGTVLTIIKARNSRITEGKSKSEEAMVIQEIYQGLSKMEKRIESLETILMDRQGKDKNTQ